MSGLPMILADQRLTEPRGIKAAIFGKRPIAGRRRGRSDMRPTDRCAGA